MVAASNNKDSADPAAAKLLPPPSVHAALWFEPQNPSQLTLAEPTTDGIGINTYLLRADAGMGCNDFETTALMKIITAHEEHFQDDSSSMKDLSQQYRSALCECLERWYESIDVLAEKEGNQQLVQDESTNLDISTQIHSIIHLSEIFLELLAPSWDNGDLFDKPGRVTADMVRFLRSNMSAVQSIAPPDVLNEMVDSQYPELFQAEGFEEGELYWMIFERLLVRGCLEGVWELLKEHSLYRTVMEDPMQQHGEIRNEFRILRMLLLRAPLPGGRNDRFDNAVGDEPVFDETIEDMDLSDDDFVVMATDYQLWEVNDGRTNVEAGDTPLFFSADKASRRWREWKQQVQNVHRTTRLKARIPQLERAFSILMGDLDNAQFESWKEQLCAELLYCTPEIRPRNMKPRALAIMRSMGGGPSDNIDQSLLEIMNGDAGEAITAVADEGGAAGAALPSALVSCFAGTFGFSRILAFC